MSDPNYILKSTVSAAVTDATNAVKPLLLAVEAAIAADGEGADTAIAALHAELAAQLGAADSLLGTGTMHTDTGGTDKD